MVRLDKYLADRLCMTRSQVKQILRSGRVQVSGVTRKDPAFKVDPSAEEITADGECLSVLPAGPAWIMMNKPSGYVTAAHDRLYPAVMELIPEKMAGRKGVFPVGRLDVDTEGLLLFTDDGAAAHRLLSPSSHVTKTYQAVLAGNITESQIRSFSEGLDIGDEKKTLPAELKVLWEGNGVSFAEISVTEGRFHQVKRMAEAVGTRVLYLRRVRMGNLALDLTLARGEVRALTDAERKMLL